MSRFVVIALTVCLLCLYSLQKTKKLKTNWTEIKCDLTLLRELFLAAHLNSPSCLQNRIVRECAFPLNALLGKQKKTKTKLLHDVVGSTVLSKMERFSNKYGDLVPSPTRWEEFHRRKYSIIIVIFKILILFGFPTKLNSSHLLANSPANSFPWSFSFPFIVFVLYQATCSSSTCYLYNDCVFLLYFFLALTHPM